MTIGSDSVRAGLSLSSDLVVNVMKDLHFLHLLYRM